jgi:lysophospholipase L1-like esterase
MGSPLLPSVDSDTKQFPDTVRTRMASNFADPTTPEGMALDGRFVRTASRVTRQTAKRPLTSGLGGRDVAPFDWVCWGTSMTEGGPANGAPEVALGRQVRWLDRLQLTLRSRYPLLTPVTGTVGYIPAFYQTFFVAGTTANGRVTPAGVTYSGNLIAVGSGLASRSLALTTTSDWIQFTFTGDSVDVFGGTLATASTTATVSVDGGAAQAWNLPTSARKATKFSVTGLTAGSHTIRITGGSVGNVAIDGIMPYNGDRTKGIRIWDGGKGSAKIGDYGTDSTSLIFQSMGLIQPRMLTIEFGFNEYFGNVDPALFQTQLTNSVSWMIAPVTVKPTVQFIVFPEPSITGAARTYPYQAYVDAVYAAAAATPNSFVTDLRSALEPGLAAGSAGLGMYFDGVHFNAYGQAAVADLILEDALARMA